MKVYTRPPHIVDTHFNFFCLDGIELSILRFYIPMTMIINREAFGFLDGYEEVTPEEFTKLCERHASKESVHKFMIEYNKLYQKY